MIRKGCLCVVAGMGLTAIAATEGIGWRETDGKVVSQGTSETQTDNLLIGDEGSFVKAGGGSLTVPLSKVNQSAPAAMTAYQGTLTLQAGADATVDLAQPPAVLQNAAFWVAADSANLMREGAGVTRWCDVRETTTASPHYPYAVPAWLDYASATRTVDKGVPPQVVTHNGRTSVFFGGSGSGQHMNWYDKNGSVASISGVYHFFAVHAVSNCWGAVLGDKNSRGFCIDAAQMPTYDTVKTAGAHFFNAGKRADMQYAMALVRWYLDGSRFDPWSVAPKRSFQLLAGDATAETVQFGAFYNQRNITSTIRQGGDYLSEAVVFTNRLSETERLSVERYLMKKWNLPCAADDDNYAANTLKPAVVQVAVAANAVCETSAGSGEVVDIAPTGEGVLRTVGAGSLRIGPEDSTADAFTGTLELGAGSVRIQGGAIPAMALAAGDRVTSAPAIDVRGSMTVTNWEQTARVELSRQTDAGADCARKEGNGTLRCNAVKDGVKRLTVADGTLVLTAPRTTDTPLPTAVDGFEATVPNADFEDAPDSEIDHANPNNRARLYLSTTPYYDWAILSGTAYYIFSVTNGVWTGSPAWETWIENKLPPRFGVECLFIKQNGAPYATVTFPADGDYELSLDATGRYAATWSKNDRRNEVGVYLGADTSDALKHRVGTLVETGQNPWNRRYFKLLNITKGAKTLLFKALNTGIDGGTAIDNIKIRYMPRFEKDVLFRVPNGDFEIRDVGVSDRISTLFKRDNPCSNWTFTASSAWTSGLTNGPVGVVSAVTRYFGTRSSTIYRDADKIWGSSMLAFNTYPVSSTTDAAKNGYGTATTTFRAPAGTFRLRARLASAATDWDDQGNKKEDCSSVGVPSIHAVLRKGSDEAIDLGYITTTRFVLTECTWPTAFTLSADEEVTLELSQPFARASTLVDDLVFVAAQDKDEVLSNGGFEVGNIGGASSGWYNFQNKTIYNYGTAEINDYVGRASDYGYNFYEGKRNLNIGQQAGVYQDVTFPSAGLYRLRFAIRSRPSDAAGHNPMRFWLHAAGDPAHTNEIVRILEHSTNFVAHACLFRVPAAGSYRFGVSGCGVNPTYATENRRMIMDGFSIMPAPTAATSAVPDVPDGTRILVAANARLVLDYDGTVKCSMLKVGDHYLHGRVTAETDPEHISGLGALEVETSGFLLFYK